MSTQPAAKPSGRNEVGIASSLVWFEIPADNLERAKAFYHDGGDYKY